MGAVRLLTRARDGPMGDQPIDRRAGRVILLDEAGAVLLFRGRDVTRPDLPTWWFTPGGGTDPGETTEQAARRELAEETGLVHAAPLGAVVHARRTEFTFEGQAIRQYEEFFALRVMRFEPTAVGWNEIERRSMLGHRWWTLDELALTTEVVYPEGLAAIVRALGG